MQFSAILTPLALAACVFVPSLSPAQPLGRDNSRLDAVITDMAQAYKVRDRKRLASLLPQVRGYALEPWAAYWELSARLEDASPAEVQDYFARYAGSYQEDKLRADWLLQLGHNRDWAAFNREYPKYRMGDDKSLRCYALLTDHLASGANVNAAVMQTWLAQKTAMKAVPPRPSNSSRTTPCGLPRSGHGPALAWRTTACVLPPKRWAF